ncbi:amidohydrolase family protein [Ectopseudomonas guguanensis]|uniref:Predicted metal-dependent hydrolase, TIM-barrel fold n=1 Tax=Ectopseudomonas guguanensis TaxID=1198456 RepID=A0A1H0XHV2_9GAMM|nr:amidohydrolase family protein [Pseudomonas guguanensis]SDQ02493.1 Predicted metal-dependent hydrolase, TIM-barrel fold [Pseudomonas guguanensis]
MNRRKLLQTMATAASATAIAGIMPSSAFASQTAATEGGARALKGLQRIDTHQHIVPPFYAKWLDSRGLNAGGLPIPTWSAEGALDLMDSNGIQTGILSVSTPGVHLGNDAEARIKAKEVNEFCAELVDKHPGRFGFFATLTLPDVAGAIEQAEYALTKLKADGVVLLANVRGTYLGTPEWDPLLEVLNRHKTTVFVHPSELPAAPVEGIPPYAADFLLDTTRAALNLAKRGCLERYPDLKIILAHAGGFVPYAAERMARVCSEDGSTAGGLKRLRQFYFDTALSSSPYALSALLAFAKPENITFGSDWPYANKERSSYFTGLLDSFGFSTAQREAVNRTNALKLFPRLA